MEAYGGAASPCERRSGTTFVSSSTSSMVTSLEEYLVELPTSMVISHESEKNSHSDSPRPFVASPKPAPGGGGAPPKHNPASGRGAAPSNGKSSPGRGAESRGIARRSFRILAAAAGKNRGGGIVGANPKWPHLPSYSGGAAAYLDPRINLSQSIWWYRLEFSGL